MKIFVKIYFFIAIFCYSIFLKYSLDNIDAWKNISTWINWYVNFVGLYAIFICGFSEKKSSTKFWRVNLIVVLSVYAYQLFDNGLFSAYASKAAKITILINYIFLVFPLVSAVIFNAKNKSAVNAEKIS